MKLILVINNDAPLVETLTARLTAEDYRCETAEDGIHGAVLLKEDRFDCALIDLMLPGRNGFDLIGEYRRSGGRKPLICVSAKSSTADKVSALRLGANDYVTKPFDFEELLARIEVQLRETNPAPAEEKSANDVQDISLSLPDYTFGPFKLAFRQAVLYKDGKEVPLSYQEYKLLCYLVRHRGEIIQKEVLMDRLWGYDVNVGMRTVYTHIAWLRGKLKTPENPDGYIRTVRQIGYLFTDEGL